MMDCGGVPEVVLSRVACHLFGFDLAFPGRRADAWKNQKEH